MKVAMFVLFYFLMSGSLSWGGVIEENITLTTPRGEAVLVTLVYPDGEEKYSAVLLASGGGYHKELPLLKETTEQLASRGVIGVRFDWNYFSKKENPSDGYVEEQEDMQTVLNFLKTHPKVESDRIIIGGKSLGSVISYRVFEENNDVMALTLLTPVCTSRIDKDGNQLPSPVPIAPKYYPELINESRQVVVMMGDRDPLCDVPMIFNFLKSATGKVALNIVEGDHSLNVGPWDDPEYSERNAENVTAAINMVAHWMNLIFNK